jgi:2-aminoethylphosphonate-pyruvate transaminase
MLLLNPGPVTLSERAPQPAATGPVPSRKRILRSAGRGARALVAAYELDPAEWAAVLMTGSGTAAVESMIAALVPQDGKLLVIENGVYGERITQIATQYGIAHDVLKHEWMQAPDVAEVAARLDAGGYSHVAVIHHETTTGRLNDLGAIADVCRARGVRMLVDGVSSFGAEAIDFGGGVIDAVAATANKCLHGVPGAAFVIVRRSALTKAASRTYYLDLGRLAKLQDQRNTPFTPSVHAYYALVEALREFDEAGGWRARHARYKALADQVQAGLAARGMPLVLPDGESSVVLRAYRLPQGVAYEALHDGLKARGFVIYAGQGGLSKELFRISTMGAIEAADVERLLEGLRR